MDHVIQPAQDGIGFLIGMITNFALFPFPGTDIPVVVIACGVWGIYFIWKWWLAQFFDIEAKK